MRPSITGLMNQQHEVHRLESLFYTQAENIYYQPTWGIDWNFFNNNQMEIPSGAVMSYINQKAMRHGIVILDIESQVQDFTMKTTVKLLDETITFNTGV